MLRDLEIDSFHPMMMKISMIDITSKCYEFKHNWEKFAGIVKHEHWRIFASCTGNYEKPRGSEEQGTLLWTFNVKKTEMLNSLPCIIILVGQQIYVPAVFLFFKKIWVRKKSEKIERTGGIFPTASRSNVRGGVSRLSLVQFIYRYFGAILNTIKS